MRINTSNKGAERLLGAGIIVALLAVIVLQANLTTSYAGKVGFTSAIVEVVPDASKTIAPAAGAVGPLYMEGPIYEQGAVNPASGQSTTGDSIGTWRMWGFKFPGSKAVVNEAYELDAFLGTIQGQGTADFDTSTATSSVAAIARNDALGVIGGTGNFKGAQGTGEMKILNKSTGAFRVTFAEAGSRPR